MDVKASVIKVDVKGVKNKIDSIKNNPSLGMFAVSEVARLLQPFVPEREGALKSATGRSKPWNLVYSTPYAAYQYYGRSKSGKKLTYSKPTATSKWDKNMSGERLRALSSALTAKVRTL